MKKISMQDIADKLGVSKGTVSLVLSGKAKSGRVSEKTCQKVKQLAAEMNYYPNEIARSLTTGRTMSIGVIVTDISNEFFGNLTFHIQERAKNMVIRSLRPTQTKVSRNITRRSRSC